jgi:hypothetical protein
VNAVANTRKRCWAYDWVVEFDIRRAFDELDWDLLKKAIAKHIKDPWCLLYIERWLTASAVSPDGKPVQRTKGVPQGSVIGPVLMNLFMTYAFDKWMEREHPNNPFSRYADDAVAHCRSEAEAKKLLASIAERLKECKLELHPEKSGIVYCKDSNRRNDYPRISFTFLGYEFRPRIAKSRDGNAWTNFLPAISASAKRSGGPPGQRIILYDYLASRTTAGLKQFFLGPDGAYQGKLVSDGLERYDDIAAELKLLHFGCLTHCRTMFFKARKVSQLPSSRTLANAAIEDYIGPVYRIEGQIRALRAEYQQRGESLPLETVLALRQEKSKPILEKFRAWIDQLLPATPPNSALGKALGYATRQWPKLVRHLDHPEIPVDNNYSEQQIKHFATGRKSWLFSYDASSAQASANLFSLVMTCRINDVEPYAYLNYLFEHLPAATTVEHVEALLPWNLKSMLDEQKKELNRPQSAT